MASVMIRPLRYMQDARACTDIAIACWNHKVADNVVDQIMEGYYFVAEIDGIIVGFVGSRKSYLAHAAWEIPWIAVSPDHHGKSIGSMLLGHMVDELDRMRRASVILTMTQRVSFFEQAGFSTVQEYNDGWSLMTRPLRTIGF